MSSPSDNRRGVIKRTSESQDEKEPYLGDNPAPTNERKTSNYERDNNKYYGRNNHKNNYSNYHKNKDHRDNYTTYKNNYNNGGNNYYNGGGGAQGNRPEIKNYYNNGGNYRNNYRKPHQGPHEAISKQPELENRREEVQKKEVELSQQENKLVLTSEDFFSKILASNPANLSNLLQINSQGMK